MTPKKIQGRKPGEGEIDNIISIIMNQPVHSLSLNQIAVLSTPARSRFEIKMTKPHNKISVHHQDHKIALLAEEESEEQAYAPLTHTQLPKAKGAPRTIGKVNGEDVEMILDGGCTSFVISNRLAIRLGITGVYKTNSSVVFGDDLYHKPIDVVSYLEIQISASDIASVEVLCFDVDKYDFIVGREGLHGLKIGTDWPPHYWYIKT
ncbi:hypothetical protein RMATCC62417_14649 [Rhizopus microsporus]|nr:hypothetical protein RMATCC62417_14649 [Rhizopus microsporus]